MNYKNVRNAECIFGLNFKIVLDIGVESNCCWKKECLEDIHLVGTFQDLHSKPYLFSMPF